MKPKLTFDNLFNDNVAKSIINLLAEYKNIGLRSIEIQYSLENNNGELHKKEIEMNKKPLKDRNGEFENNLVKIKCKIPVEKLDYLEKNNRIVKGCIRHRSQLSYYLELLCVGDNNLGVIEKEGSYKKIKYFINNNVYKLSIIDMGKKNYDSFPIDKIKLIDKRIEGSSDIFVSHFLYGISDRLYKEIFDNKDRNKINENIKKIYSCIQEIENIKLDKFETEWKKKVENFIKKCKSNKIKICFKENYNRLISMFEIVASHFMTNDNRVDETKNKYDYFFHFGIPSKKASRNTHWIKKQISEAMEKYLKNYSKENMKSYLREWSLGFFDKNYNFSKSDVFDIINFGWNNREIFFSFKPYEVEYSMFTQKYPNIFDNKT